MKKTNIILGIVCCFLTIQNVILVIKKLKTESYISDSNEVHRELLSEVDKLTALQEFIGGYKFDTLLHVTLAKKGLEVPLKDIPRDTSATIFLVFSQKHCHTCITEYIDDINTISSKVYKGNLILWSQDSDVDVLNRWAVGSNIKNEIVLDKYKLSVIDHVNIDAPFCIVVGPDFVIKQCYTLKTFPALQRERNQKKVL